MKIALVGLTAATLAVGVLGAAPAAADHYNSTGVYNATAKGDRCGLDRYRDLGFWASGVVTQIKVTDPEPGDVSTRYDSYRCRFEGLPSYAEGDYSEPYYGPTTKPYTYKVTCMNAFSEYDGMPGDLAGTLKIFKNGTATLKCG